MSREKNWHIIFFVKKVIFSDVEKKRKKVPEPSKVFGIFGRFSDWSGTPTTVSQILT